MTRFYSAVLIAVSLLAVPSLPGQESPAKIAGDLAKLRSLPDQKRSAATIKAANEIAALPPGMEKVELADRVSQRVTEGDQGHGALQAVADALSKALRETAVRTRSTEVPQPYMDLARLVRYENVSVSLDDPLFKKALDILADDEADVAKANFTLTDIDNKKWTLSELRGKIVLVNFWATWCPPCRAEMPNLDAIYTHFQNEGLVILSITDEDSQTVQSFLRGKDYHPPVLLDPGGVAHKEFHVQGIPQTFVFDRDGKLMGIAIDQSTQKQFLALLGKAGLQPE
ncbi:MAG TPA: TlpA disulfide reductase family protein [Terracidiphilus sp.]|jgi:thiol-disulfide isomerase/thioredoxin